MTTRRPISSRRMTERELDLHNEANRIAHLLFIQFYAELKKTSLSELTAPEAMALATDCVAILSSQALGTIFMTLKNELSDFVTEQIIIDTENKAFKKSFECFIKLQSQMKEKNE